MSPKSQLEVLTWIWCGLAAVQGGLALLAGRPVGLAPAALYIGLIVWLRSGSAPASVLLGIISILGVAGSLLLLAISVSNPDAWATTMGVVILALSAWTAWLTLGSRPFKDELARRRAKQAEGRETALARAEAEEARR